MTRIAPRGWKSPTQFSTDGKTDNWLFPAQSTAEAPQWGTAD